MGCMACYAFSAIAALEAMIKIKQGLIINLSEQEIIECSKEYKNSGCKGG